MVWAIAGTPSWIPCPSKSCLVDTAGLLLVAFGIAPRTHPHPHTHIQCHPRNPVPYRRSSRPTMGHKNFRTHCAPTRHPTALLCSRSVQVAPHQEHKPGGQWGRAKRSLHMGCGGTGAGGIGGGLPHPPPLAAGTSGPQASEGPWFGGSAPRASTLQGRTSAPCLHCTSVAVAIPPLQAW